MRSCSKCWRAKLSAPSFASALPRKRRNPSTRRSLAARRTRSAPLLIIWSGELRAQKYAVQGTCVARVEITARAMGDLERLFDFIAEEDPARACKQVLSVRRALEL